MLSQGVILATNRWGLPDGWTGIRPPFPVNVTQPQPQRLPTLGYSPFLTGLMSFLVTRISWAKSGLSR